MCFQVQIPPMDITPYLLLMQERMQQPYQLTQCGLSGLLRAQGMQMQKTFASAASGVRQRSKLPQTSHSDTSRS